MPSIDLLSGIDDGIDAYVCIELLSGIVHCVWSIILIIYQYTYKHTIEHVLPMSMYKFTQFDRYFLVDSRYIMFYKIK